MNIQNDVTGKANEANLQSSGVAEGERLYILPGVPPLNNNLWKETWNYYVEYYVE